MNEDKAKAEHIVSAQSLIAHCREHERVCPLPLKWNALWELLPERRQMGAGWQPSPPLILAAWHDTSNEEKMLRLTEHIDWADKHSSLPLVATFLCNLAESDWHHAND
jgi:hypothetical protein